MRNPTQLAGQQDIMANQGRSQILLRPWRLPQLLTFSRLIAAISLILKELSDWFPSVCICKCHSAQRVL